MTGDDRSRDGVPECPRRRVRVLAGPYQCFGPLTFTPEKFQVIEGDLEVVPMPVGWIPVTTGPQTHGDLASDADDGRLRVAARIIHEDISAASIPLLVLPELSRQLLDGTPAAPGRIGAAEMLRRLQLEVGPSEYDVRLMVLDGLDTAGGRAGVDVDLARLRDRLHECGVENVTTSVRFFHASHPAYWRAAANRLSSMGELASEHAAKFLSRLSDDDLVRAAFDDDGRQVLEMAPPSGFVPPPVNPDACADDEVDEGRSEGSETAVLVAPAHIDSPSRERRLPVRPTSRIDCNGRRIAFVCEKMADRSGGAERVLVELANELCRRGYQVDILSHELRGKPAFYPLEFGVVHSNLSPRRGATSLRDQVSHKARSMLQARQLTFPLDRLAFKIRYIDFQQRLRTYIDAVRPDVVVPFMPPAIVATALARTEYRPRLVASMHNAPEQDFENPDRWDPGRYARSRRIELMDRMDAIAVLLPEYQDWYSGTLRARTSVVPNPVEPVAPEILAGAERCKTILAVGRLADTKRHDLTLRAFAILSPDFPEWRLKIFGVGPFEERLNDLRDELGLLGRAELPGHTTTIRDEYLSASILCHPARFEGFPLAVTESLASGVPVVGFSDCSGVNSLVVDGENGVLVDPGDGSDDGRLRALTEALRILMSDDAYRKSLSERGPESMEPYRPARVADRWEQVLFPE